MDVSYQPNTSKATFKPRNQMRKKLSKFAKICDRYGSTNRASAAGQGTLGGSRDVGLGGCCDFPLPGFPGSGVPRPILDLMDFWTSVKCLLVIGFSRFGRCCLASTKMIHLLTSLITFTKPNQFLITFFKSLGIIMYLNVNCL